MAEILGLDIGIEAPKINITGLLSNTWIYVLLIGLIGMIIIVVVGLLLFFKTYNRRIIVFENVSGLGYQPVLKTRARIVKLGISGEEVLKTLAGGYYVTAYGKKMGKRTYWFAKAIDGYWYNVVLGDLDTKLAMLDIEPIDRDVRMFHVSVGRLAAANYDKKSFLEKYGPWIFVGICLIIVLGGMWVISGQIAKAASGMGQASEILANAIKSVPQSSGIIPA